jgi:hypothetical protein
LNALALLLPEPLVRHDGPSTLQVMVNEQAAQKRWVVHLLHYIPERRSQEIDIIEDIVPLYNLHLSVKVPQPVREVACVPRSGPNGLRSGPNGPEQSALACQWMACGPTQRDGRVEFVVPTLVGHQMVALSFE